MNAYELANKMEQLAGHFHNEAINMLRQQADRIAELEKDLEGCEYFLDKQQSAEPVAWMDTNGVPSAVKSELYSTPLYTTPHHASDVKQIKELSDEEIVDLWMELFDESMKDIKVFAKAILKKASEK